MMAVYVDNMKLPFKGRLMCHMTADSLSELHDMAARIGMKQIWFQCPPKARYPHHDIDEIRRDLALSFGAVSVTNKASLHYAARLGLEWIDSSQDIEPSPALALHYQSVISRTQKFIF